MATTFSSKCFILGTLFIQESDNEEFSNFFEFNDIGLPLAYSQSQGLCEVTDNGKTWIEGSWGELMEALAIEDTGFENLNEVFALAK
jgi:hypothetical protein